MQGTTSQTTTGLRTRVRRDAAVVAALIGMLTGASLFWELPMRLSGHPWDSTLRSGAGHLVIVVAGAHLIMIGFGYRRSRELKSAVRHNEYLALHDPLTGLPNRILFFDRLERALAHSRREQHLVGVLMFDLDGFKDINDRHGHLAGDQLLRQIGSRLAMTARDTDTVARIGGDEFVVLITGAAKLTAVRQATSRLVSTFGRPFDIDGRTLRMTASVGLAIHDGDHIAADELLRRADMAMYSAKRAGGGLHVFSRESPPPAPSGTEGWNTAHRV